MEAILALAVLWAVMMTIVVLALARQRKADVQVAKRNLEYIGTLRGDLKAVTESKNKLLDEIASMKAAEQRRSVGPLGKKQGGRRRKPR